MTIIRGLYTVLFFLLVAMVANNQAGSDKQHREQGGLLSDLRIAPRSDENVVSPCRIAADAVVDGIPGVALAKMTKSAVRYSWAGSDIFANCAYGPEVGSVWTNWEANTAVPFPDYLRVSAALVVKFAGEPESGVRRFLDRCMARAKKDAYGIFQAVGKKATVNCSVLPDGTAITIHRREPDDTETAQR